MSESQRFQHKNTPSRSGDRALTAGHTAGFVSTPPLQSQKHPWNEFGAMRESEQDKLDRVVRRILPELLGFAVRLTGDRDSAEELVQEAMLRAVRNWSSFRREANPKTWLYSIAVNAFRDNLRSKQNQQKQLDCDLTTNASGPEQQTLANELAAAVAHHVTGLPPRQREVLILITYEGLSVREVGEVLDMKPSSVYANLHHARSNLRDKLQPYLDTESTRR